MISLARVTEGLPLQAALPLPACICHRAQCYPQPHTPTTMRPLNQALFDPLFGAGGVVLGSLSLSLSISIYIYIHTYTESGALQDIRATRLFPAGAVLSAGHIKFCGLNSGSRPSASHRRHCTWTPQVRKTMAQGLILHSSRVQMQLQRDP